MLKTKQLIALLVVFLVFVNITNAQQRGSRVAPPVQKQEQTTAVDSVKKAPEKGPISIEKFIKPGTKPMVGLTTVYNQEGRFFININDTLLDRDIIMVTRISKAAAGIRSDFDGYAGDHLNTAMFRFEMGPNNKIFLRKILNRERSKDSTQAMFTALQRSNLAGISATFEIKAKSADKRDNIIDVTDLFNTDSETLFFRKSTKSSFKLGAPIKESSYISAITTYPINTEVKTVKTYMLADGSATATYELNNSFVLLPKVPMVPRYADSRVGYFTTGYTDYDQNPQGVKDIRMITRWRLEPKPQDVEKYKRGELVEPAKPIVFYIDPATPKDWVPYLIQGVNDWQKVFEKAGFKNAIYALEAPTAQQNPEWSLEDARFSAIVYKPSDIPNASGPNVNDPRSGEIIESHINWYHNVMSLLRNWYMVQCSPVDPAARKMIFGTELMGQLIRFVSSHEVGHTLGLRHNFGGTGFYTVEQLRDKDFLKENGHTTSIMDYSRFNYVAQPEDNIPRELLFPRLSHYDDWAIEWGYRRFPEINDPVKELTKINLWTIEKTKDRRYWFGTESSSNDPRLQAEDLGDNQMKANELGIKNLKVVMANLGEWSKMPNEEYDNLRTMHTEVNNQFRRYIGHVAKWVGGIYQESKTVEMDGDVYIYVEREKQVEAMDFLNRNLFVNTPLWLIPTEYMSKFPSRNELFMERAYSTALSSIVSRRVIMNLVAAESALGKSAYSVEELFNSLNKTIMFNLGTSREVDIYKRVLQKVYVTTLCDLFTGAATVARMGAVVKPSSNPKDMTECTAIAYTQLSDLLKKLKKTKSSDFATAAHTTYLTRYIEKTFISVE
ncbi:MAG: hypothetical protein A2266_01220 [Bacteroidetes bacterium RIFOXYA12_FULL_40_10]|nr:MAG: hypothetical protein A2266_01220 [Bacteroidetes bacterium RIFOXYA12_FULL_40_10]